MKVLFGLGNPGRRYAGTRHNIGARIVRQFAKDEGIPLSKSVPLGAVWGKRKDTPEEIRVVLPSSYMNLSGPVVLRCLKRWLLSPGQILVIVDDLHLPLGEMRIRPGGSDGGQKGLRSVVASLGTERFPRLRVGIQSGPFTEAWESFVLEPFSRKEEILLEKAVEKAVACCRLWTEKGIERCMNQFNRKDPLA